ncbi:MAG: M50 family metallopeptidase [Armatimonadetes bacterium]|nr:M50 family metallopeptidase [Armatimonadota bacterium]
MSYPKPSVDRDTNLPGVRSLQHLIIAALITVGLYFVPYLSFLTYPIRLLVTFIHEGSHALAAILTGGHVASLVIRPDGSGVTWSSGGIGIVTSSAGYLGATLFGALLIAALRRGVPGRHLLLGTGTIVALLTLCFARASNLDTLANLPLTIGAGAVIGGGLIFAGLKMPERSAVFAASFIGVQCILNALFDLHTLFSLSASGVTQSDAGNMQAMTMIPAVVWSVLWIAVAAFLLWRVVLVPAFRDARASATG